MDAWLSQARDVLAREAGLDPTELELSADEERTLLELARIAAHSSGERTNAPLLCYLAGVARREGAALDRLAAAVEEIG
jgi:Domain of unknown function (DUF6457)